LYRLAYLSCFVSTKGLKKINLIETLETDYMQNLNSYHRSIKNDLFLFLKSLIRNSFSIAGMQMEIRTSEFLLSPSTSPYIKRLNAYHNQLKIEPIIINI
jgi:hypothetical protein